MAPKDYVSRGRVKKAPPPAKKSVPWLKISLIIALIFAFIFFLWSLKEGAESRVANQDSEVTAKTDKQIDNDPLPILQPDEYGFAFDLEKEYRDDELPSGEKIPVMADSGKKYIMQCGSFRALKQAETMEAKIGFLGLDAQVRVTEGKNGRWYRVYLGPYKQARLADVDKHRIRKSGILGCQVWGWNL